MSRKKYCFCGFKFDEGFPDDFPDRFKFCCSCLGIAITIVREGIDNVVSFLGKVLDKKTEKYDRYVEKHIKIDKLITVNHEQKR